MTSRMVPRTCRTAPTSPSWPAMTLHSEMNSAAATVQYLETRFHTSAAGRSITISMGIDVYVGFSTTGLLLTTVEDVGVCALIEAARQTTATRTPQRTA